ncbi:NUDIX hydrolase [Clostridium swellfunianum]|uniref:NUDIX hydrolase n=1 Tax=Clostridium swellfunianum TaxID=1367462 RepID=UPI0020309F0C|nr:NUDIX hydrolase [Clostridium swellfunianum]MCM0648622.1 NUDIX hydrolase [Clostridium swellfunianum]
MKTEVYNNGYYRVYDENNIISLEALKGGAVIIPVTTDKKIVLIKSFRPSINQFSTELPRGFLEVGELPKDGARRELFEEIGGTAVRFESLGVTATNNGISNEMVEYFIAWDAKYSCDKLQVEENIVDAVEFDLAELINLAGDNKITDAFTLCGVLKFIAKYRNLR